MSVSKYLVGSIELNIKIDYFFSQGFNSAHIEIF